MKLKLPRLFSSPLLLLAMIAILGFGVVQLQGCAATGQPTIATPKDFGQIEIVTKSIATEVLAQANILMVGGVIRPDDARSLVKQTDQVMDDVKLAKAMNLTQPATALDRINLALQTIQGLRGYLVRKGATFTPAATG